MATDLWSGCLQRGVIGRHRVRVNPLPRKRMFGDSVDPLLAVRRVFYSLNGA